MCLHCTRTFIWSAVTVVVLLFSTKPLEVVIIISILLMNTLRLYDLMTLWIAKDRDGLSINLFESQPMGFLPTPSCFSDTMLTSISMYLLTFKANRSFEQAQLRPTKSLYS